MNQSISILMPIYNGSEFLRPCLESLVGQTDSSFEVVVSDDGSKDGSQEIVQSFADERFRILEGGGHLGLFGNLNRLISEARGNWLLILCQDDVLEPHCLSTWRQFLAQHPRVPFAYCKANGINSEGQIFAPAQADVLPPVMETELSLQHFFYHGCIPGNLSTVIFRRDLAISLGGFSEEFAVSGDYDMWARMGMKNPMGVCPSALVRLRTHGKRLSAQGISGLQFVMENRRIRREVFPHLPPGARKSARRYEIRRHGVLDWHYALRCLGRGKVKYFLAVLGVIGWDLPKVIFYWLITVNNRLYRPQASWILPEESSDAQDLSRASG